MITTVMVAYVRHKVPGLNKDNAAQNFKQEHIKELKDYLKERFGKNKSEYEFFENRINFLANDWEERITLGLTEYSKLMKRPTDTGVSEKDDWVIMQSMREVDADTFVEIKQNYAAAIHQTNE